MIRIALDAMGSDSCPEPEVQAAIEAVQQYQDEIFLVGHEEQIKARLQALGGDQPKIRVISAPDTITMEDKGLKLALKAKRRGSQTSMAVGIDLVIQGEADLRGVPFDVVARESVGGQSIARFVEPEEVADLCVFLGSDRARMINGEAIAVDGHAETFHIK